MNTEKSLYKLLITEYRKKPVSILYQNGIPYDIELHAEDINIINSVHIAKVKNIVKNLEAAFIEIKTSSGNILCFYSLKENKSHLYTDSAVHKELKEGDEIIVQVIKAGVKTKAPVASSFISLAGRYTVVGYGKAKLMFSSKIQDKGFKNEMKEALLPELNENICCTLRTNSQEAKKEDIEAELSELSERLLNLIHSATYQIAPVCLLKGESSMESLIKKLPKDSEIITDIEFIYEDIREHGNVRLYRDELIGLAKLYSVESIISEALSKKVWLKSGGYLIIENTEAMTVIDVNTGKADLKLSKKEMLKRVNREAAVEICRQLRLRNISGMIIVDFADTSENDFKQELMRLLSEELSKDFVKAAAVDYTALGLAELTRKKIKRPLYEVFNETFS